jgi:hypothetical protein
MVNEVDMAKFNEFRVNVTKKFFDDLPQVRALHAARTRRGGGSSTAPLA